MSRAELGEGPGTPVGQGSSCSAGSTGGGTAQSILLCARDMTISPIIRPRRRRLAIGYVPFSSTLPKMTERALESSPLALQASVDAVIRGLEGSPGSEGAEVTMR